MSAASRFSETVMEHFQSPRNNHAMPNADRVGTIGVPGQGRHLIIYLKLDRDHVVNASFRCHPCGATIASGSVLVEHVLGRSVSDCLQLTPGWLLEALGGLPPDKQHCATYAIEALRQALAVPLDGHESAPNQG